MAADDAELLALLDRSLATAPVEPAPADVAFQRRLVLERRAAAGRTPFSKGLRVGVGLGMLTLAGVAGVAAASQGVLPAGETPSSTLPVSVPAPVPLSAPTTMPATSTVPVVPTTATRATSPPASTATTTPAATASSTPTSIDDHGGRSGSNSGPGSGSSGSGSSGSGSSGSDSSG
jgi:hypothetical protein